MEIDLGGGLTFRIAGRIDRIDKVGPSEFQVLDYKTGGFWRDDWKGTFNGGRRLQHALYGLAAVELLRRALQERRRSPARVTTSPATRDDASGCSIAAPSLAQTAAVLGDLRELIVDGAFVHAADEKACKWCDYDGRVRRRRSRAGRRQAADAKLNAFGRLAAHD